MSAKTRKKGGRIGDVVRVKNHQRKFGANKEYNAIRVQFADGQERTALFSDAQIRVALERAEKNPEDIPQVGLLRDLFD